MNLNKIIRTIVTLSQRTFVTILSTLKKIANIQTITK